MISISTPTRRAVGRGLPRQALLGAAAVTAAVGVGGFAFTNSNTVPDSKAGDGSGAVSGYTISAIDYGLNSSDPSLIDSVSFNLDSTPAAGSTIKAKVDGNWYSCTATVAAVTCGTTSPQATVATHTTLQVVVAD